MNQLVVAPGAAVRPGYGEAADRARRRRYGASRRAASAALVAAAMSAAVPRGTSAIRLPVAGSLTGSQRPSSAAASVPPTSIGTRLRLGER